MTHKFQPELSASQAAGVYAQSSIENAPPVKIVRLLYQGAIRFLDNAAAADPGAPGSRFDHWLRRAEDIVVELRLSIEASHAPAIAESLTELYVFVEVAIGRARQQRSTKQLLAARAVLAKLLEAWTEIDTGKA